MKISRIELRRLLEQDAEKSIKLSDQQNSDAVKAAADALVGAGGAADDEIVKKAVKDATGIDIQDPSDLDGVSRLASGDLVKDDEVKAITESMLRHLIRESLIDKAENLATATLSQAGVGDAAALTKALTVDLGRAVSAMGDLNQLLVATGTQVFELGVLPKDEINLVASKIAAYSEDEKSIIRESVVEFAEAIRRIFVSLISASPDVAISTSAAYAISVFPIETFLLKGGPMFADFVDFLEKNKYAKYALKLYKILYKLTLGPIGWLFGEPVTSCYNLGRILEATHSHSRYGQVAKDMNMISNDEINSMISERKYR